MLCRLSYSVLKSQKLSLSGHFSICSIDSYSALLQHVTVMIVMARVFQEIWIIAISSLRAIQYFVVLCLVLSYIDLIVYVCFIAVHNYFQS